MASVSSPRGLVCVCVCVRKGDERCGVCVCTDAEEVELETAKEEARARKG